MNREYKIPRKVKKRDGRVVDFDVEKLVGVIDKAGVETGEFGKREASRLADIAVSLLVKTNGEKTPHVEDLQDIVEQVLMAASHFGTAKAYILYRQERSDARRSERMIGVEDDLGLNVNQLKILESRYLLKDEEGKVIESPSEMFRRVAGVLAGVERKYRAPKKKIKRIEDEFFEVMTKLEFLPAGRTLNNAGTVQNQLASCFVLPVEDSMEGIFDAVKWMALVHQGGGGTGFNFSKLRPKGDVVTKSTGGFATGPVSFMKVFDMATRQVMQGGKKRGGNMGLLNVDHPDVLEFIASKAEGGEIENFNISVGVSDAFMRAVEGDKDWDLVNSRSGEVISTLKARSLMNQLVAMAWRTGDPGLIFLDAINKNNPLLESVGKIEATNPCGEQPLHPFDACNLGSINLAKLVKESGLRGENGFEVDWERLRQVVRVAVRMLDNVIDVCKYPLPQITKRVKQNRRIGLGVMGFADMLYQLRLSYDSVQGVKLAGKVAKFIRDESWKMSEELAGEKGVFPAWKGSWFEKGKAKICSKGRQRRVRNVAITTVAPTGSISMLADVSSGVEPLFALAYVKGVVEETGLTYVNSYFQKELEGASWADGGPEHKVRDRIIREISASGTVAQISGVPSGVKKVYRTAHDISPEWHVKMQSVWQEWTDNAVSKTINFPNSATIDDVGRAYMLAWKAGCKGITIYRDGSREYQVLMVGKQGESGKKPIIQSRVRLASLKERKSGGRCPECETKLVVEEGCSKCYGCGYSVCTG